MRLKLPITGCLVFTCILLLVYSLDIGISALIPAGKNSEGIGITTRHFSWHFSQFFSYDGISVFITRIVDGKTGILADPLLYTLILLLFTFLTVFFYINIFRKPGNPVSPVSGRSFSFTRGGGTPLLLILAWLSVKQILFIFIVPPWQEPDEPFHFLVSASLESEVGEIAPKILKSTETFNFMNYTERKHGDHVPYWRSKEDLWNNQPPLYYLLNSSLLNLAGTKDILTGVYLGRTISALCLLVTVLAVYFIALNLFSGPDRAMLAGLCSLFAATHPQLSCVGATMSPDAMVNMFITGAVFFLLLSIRAESLRKIVICYICAILLSVLSMLTKRSGFSMVPVLLFAGLQVCYLRFTSSFRSGLLPLLVPALIAAGMVLLYGVFMYFDLNLVLSERVINYSKEVVESRFHGVWSRESLRILTVLFTSFWLSLGWMVFKASLGTYVFFGLISSVVVYGATTSYRRNTFNMENYQWTLLLFHGSLVFMMAFTHFDSQGRYMFPAAGFFSVLFAVGAGSVIPETYRSVGIKIIEGNLILICGAVVYGLLIPVFYLV